MSPLESRKTASGRLDLQHLQSLLECTIKGKLLLEDHSNSDSKYFLIGKFINLMSLIVIAISSQDETVPWKITCIKYIACDSEDFRYVRHREMLGSLIENHSSEKLS